MPTFTVLLDACVLYPAPLRDFLMHLSLTDLFKARWTAAIHDEWIRNLLNDRPDLTFAQLERTRTLMDTAVPDSLITEYEHLIETLTLPDPNDRHVLAAAVQANASIIVTYNLKDFPASTLKPHDVLAQHPDEFISDLFSAAPEQVVSAARRHRHSLKNPPMTIEAYLQVLERARLTKAVSELRLHLDEL